MKEFEGKTVVLRPTGNNAQRYGTHKSIEAVIEKVGRAFVTFREAGSTHLQKYRYVGRTLTNQHNGGYVVYASQQECDEYFEVRTLAYAIIEKYRYTSHYEEVDLPTLRKVAELLGVTAKSASTGS